MFRLYKLSERMEQCKDKQVLALLEKCEWIGIQNKCKNELHCIENNTGACGPPSYRSKRLEFRETRSKANGFMTKTASTYNTRWDLIFKSLQYCIQI